jgi:hypothetical protein
VETPSRYPHRERFEGIPDDVRARLAARGIDPDKSLQGLLNEIRTGQRFGQLLAAVREPQEEAD